MGCRIQILFIESTDEVERAERVQVKMASKTGEFIMLKRGAIPEKGKGRSSEIGCVGGEAEALLLESVVLGDRGQILGSIVGRVDSGGREFCTRSSIFAHLDH